MKGGQTMYEIFSQLFPKLGVTAYKVSKATGISQSSLSDWKLGKVTPNIDGSYTIFIETSLSKKGQQEAFIHAMKHILGNDFEKIDIDKIETDAHSI